jgi:hypothetical protein
MTLGGKATISDIWAVVDRVDEVTQVAPETVELPDNQRVAFAQRLQVLQARPIVLLAGGLVRVQARRLHAGCTQRVALQIEHLRAVRLRYPHVADQHVSPMSLIRSIV